MTFDKHRKRKIRALARKMGASYSTARSAFLASEEATDEHPSPTEVTRVERRARIGEDTPTGELLLPAVGDQSLAAFQDSAWRPNPFALGPTANELLDAFTPPDERPSIDRRRLSVTLLWGDTIIDVRTFAPGQKVTVGPSPEASFRIYDAAIPETFELVIGDRLRLPPGARVALREDGAQIDVDLRQPLGLDARAVVSLSSTHLVLRWVRSSSRVKAAAFETVDRYFTKVLSVALIAHLALLAGFWISPRDQKALSEDLFTNPGTLVRQVIRPPPTPKDRWVLPPRPSGPRHVHPPGRRGTPSGRVNHPKPPKPGDAERHAQVMKAGLLAGIGPLTKLLGAGGPSGGVSRALEALNAGDEIGDSRGIRGVASRGEGPGGGGTALDIGSVDGPGVGPKGAREAARGNLELGTAGKPEVHLMQTRTTVVSSLGKDVIAAIIRKHQNEIRYCYEAELNRRPELAGKVAVAFTIGGSGRVEEASVAESTMGDDRVDRCITASIRRWTFPEPKGGGQVFVTYPWLFKTSESAE